jgi:hypothetical protein
LPRLFFRQIEVIGSITACTRVDQATGLCARACPVQVDDISRAAYPDARRPPAEQLGKSVRHDG